MDWNRLKGELFRIRNIVLNLKKLVKLRCKEYIWKMLIRLDIFLLVNIWINLM